MAGGASRATALCVVALARVLEHAQTQAQMQMQMKMQMKMQIGTSLALNGQRPQCGPRAARPSPGGLPADVNFLVHHGLPFAGRSAAAKVPRMKEHIGRSVGAADEAERAGGVPADDSALLLHG